MEPKQLKSSGTQPEASPQEPLRQTLDKVQPKADATEGPRAGADQMRADASPSKGLKSHAGEEAQAQGPSGTGGEGAAADKAWAQEPGRSSRGGEGSDPVRGGEGAGQGQADAAVGNGKGGAEAPRGDTGAPKVHGAGAHHAGAGVGEGSGAAGGETAAASEAAVGAEAAAGGAAQGAAATAEAGTAAQATGGFLSAVSNIPVIGGAVNAVVSGVTGAGTAVAGALGISTTAGTAVAATALAGVLMGVGVGAVSVNAATQHLWAGPAVVDDCAVQVASLTGSAGDVDAEAEKLKAATNVASVFSSLGLNDNQIAGILGVWECESGIDASTIEALFLLGDDEDYNPTGPNHRKAMADLDAFCTTYVFPKTPSAVPSLYKASDGKHYPGMGICQWTPGKVIIDAAASIDKDTARSVNWYDLDFQLAYILATGAPTGYRYPGSPDYFSGFAEATKSMSAGECAVEFACTFEIASRTAFSPEQLAQRSACAEAWASRLPAMAKDSAYASQVFAWAEDLKGASIDSVTMTQISTCKSAETWDNSSIAQAALSFAWENESLAGNDGTELYKKVHDGVLPGDTVYKACDRVVTCAVRWSGYDDDYATGGVAAAEAYMKTSERWEELGSATAVELQPGDVLLRNDAEQQHTMVYVGNGLAVSQFPGADADMDCVEGSMDRSSAHLDSFSYRGEDTKAAFTAYRCVNGQRSSVYTDVAGGVAGGQQGVHGEVDTSVAAGAKGQAILRAAMRTPSPGQGYCAMWVSQVYQNAGLGYPGGNACDQYYAFCRSSNKADLVPGMIVAVPRHPNTPAGQVYGHVGVYIGNNLVRENIGSVVSTDLDKWIAFYGGWAAPKWGWAA